jgi:hypothetical protein
MGAVITTPLLTPLPATAQTRRFFDVPSNHWATGFIEELATRGIINGFPDGTFHPEEQVTRAQFAAMVQKAFDRRPRRHSTEFADVPSSYWGYGAIAAAYSTGFMSGYPDGHFYPEQAILRSQVIMSLTNGLGYETATATVNALQLYSDASDIPDYARNAIATATEKRLVVNFPNPRFLSPNRVATRAEVAAFLYQAMASAGQVSSIASPYIVAQTSNPPSSTQTLSPPSPSPTHVRIPAGTTLPTQFERDVRIYISPEEAGPIPATLLIDRDIVSPSNVLLIPRNSRVVGEFRQVRGGSQFQASALMFPNGTQLALDASSTVINRTETIYRGANVNTLVAQAVLSAGAAAGIAAVTGDRTIPPQDILGHASFNTMIRQFEGRDQIILYSINPNTDLDVTLNAPLVLQ